MPLSSCDFTQHHSVRTGHESNNFFKESNNTAASLYVGLEMMCMARLFFQIFNTCRVMVYSCRMRSNHFFSPLTCRSTAVKTSRPVSLWTPHRYCPESAWVRLIIVALNAFTLVSSWSLNLPLCWLVEVNNACCRHVERRLPLQKYFWLFWSPDSYGQSKDTVASSWSSTLMDWSQQVSASKINNITDCHKYRCKYSGSLLE